MKVNLKPTQALKLAEELLKRLGPITRLREIGDFAEVNDTIEIDIPDEQKEPAIFDPNANIKAIAIRFDRGSETWQLQAVGTEAECKASCDRQRSKGCEEQMRVYQADLM